MRYPSMITAQSIRSLQVSCQLDDGRWVLARPEGFSSIRSRLRCAWLVFTGRADALIWEQQ